MLEDRVQATVTNPAATATRRMAKLATVIAIGFVRLFILASLGKVLLSIVLSAVLSTALSTVCIGYAKTTQQPIKNPSPIGMRF
jgi:hypothetical protein